MDNFVLRDQDLFLVANINGEVDPSEDGVGLYTKDTRFLSENRLMINGEKPALLSKQPQANHLTSFRYMYEVHDQGAIEIVREPLISNGVFYEKMTFTNYFPTEYQFESVIQFQADFKDMFLVRGFRGGNVGELTGTNQEGNSLVFSYKGKDDLLRKTKVSWDTQLPSSVNGNCVQFDVNLQAKESVEVVVKVTPLFGDNEVVETETYEIARNNLTKKYEGWYASLPTVVTDDQQFMDMYGQAVDDLQMLLVDIGYGDTTVAGIPWYAVPFGRDSIITALFMLSVKPEIAKNTLKTLAAYQGKENNPEKDEEPGKIMHELRFGELSNTGQTPFTPYYGTVDATSLFLVLATEYYHWTKDDNFIKEIKPHLDMALEWVRSKEKSLDNPFVQYKRNAEKGIPNQGWKDSSNSMVHKDGSYAESPIALIEVQGYVYAAKKGLSAVYAELGYSNEGEVLAEEATSLLSEIENYFWMEDEGYYAMALDGDNGQVGSVSSNTGHLLFADVDHKDEIVHRLFGSQLNSGYGVRTMSSSEKGYYPMSYHNGSVWPHDNGMILIGLQKHHFNSASRQLMTQLLEASLHFEDQRLPELYCGHDRGEEDLLVPYLTTCSPQAWAAATAILYVQMIAGVKPNALNKTIEVKPNLLDSMNEWTIEDMKVGFGKLSLKVQRNSDDSVTFEVIENSTGYEIIR
ncbi:amylo-alpha-1,6-glucosidase [Bacillus shivajii]|uniref:amylo-alpha-1,6-glucosidase n=1 Tax=Bacillus shivajii TaxID=1983719 RepID=UPI001CFB32D7|nr:glycogen debranching N-terminal domain-containing protein [Bacillus shivajii]UCZ52477.1 amylo-alpha-1,6-glucosidase [Bacillus shivajii]